MASLREYGVIHFAPDTDQLTVDTADISVLVWELLTQGVSYRLIKRALKAYYHRAIRPLWSDEGYPDESALMDYLKDRDLVAAVYRCVLRIGTAVKEMKDPDEPMSLLEIKAKEKEEMCEDRLIARFAPFKPEVHVKIPKHDEGINQGKATAWTVTKAPKKSEVDIEPEKIEEEDVHVKWGTDLGRIKSLYHEAQIYEKLRLKNIQITPKFYGFYQKYSGPSPFAVSVFERSEIFPVEEADLATTMHLFVRAAQRLHREGICHGALLKENKETGRPEISENVRVRVIPGDPKEGKKRIARRVFFVNFEKAYRHPGRSCPSTNENLKMIKKGGCPELDNIYDFIAPWDPEYKKPKDIDKIIAETASPEMATYRS